MPPAKISMALPIVQIASDCADYARTLRPYLNDLRPLPRLIHEHITDTAALQQLYVDTNPFISGIAISLFLSPFFLFFAELNQNWSQIDRVWSILPTLYNAHWALWTHLSDLATERMNLRLIVSTIWSTRLTFNYWRRGGYQIGSEDYRWTIIKNKIGQPAFFVLDVLFISSAQNILLFLVTAPSYILVLLSRLDTARSNTAITGIDYLFAGTVLYFVGQSFVADQQQWNYQTAKYKYRHSAKVPTDCGFTAEELDRGFRTTGLWAYSRHPNFTSEICVWWTFYLWSSVLVGSLLNWTIIGPVIYTSIFLGSTPITEYISADKYPEYKEYQKQVGMFFPKSTAPPRFSRQHSPQKKRIANGSADAEKKKTEGYEHAKKRYDLR